MPENRELFDQDVQAHVEKTRAQLESILDPTEESQKRLEQTQSALAKVWLGPLSERREEMAEKARDILRPLLTIIHDFKPEETND